MLPSGRESFHGCMTFVKIEVTNSNFNKISAPHLQILHSSVLIISLSSVSQVLRAHTISGLSLQNFWENHYLSRVQVEKLRADGFFEEIVLWRDFYRDRIKGWRKYEIIQWEIRKNDLEQSFYEGWIYNFVSSIKIFKIIKYGSAWGSGIDRLSRRQTFRWRYYLGKAYSNSIIKSREYGSFWYKDYEMAYK